MNRMELFELVNGKDTELSAKHADFIQNKVSAQRKAELVLHQNAFNEFVHMAVTAFLTHTDVHYSEQEFYMHLSQEQELQEKYQSFVQTFFSDEERKSFEKHAMAINNFAFEVLAEFAKEVGITIED